MALWIVRGLFLVVAAAIGAGLGQKLEPINPWLVFGGVVLVAVTVLVADIQIRRKNLETISAIYFGVVVGLFLSYVLGLALEPLLPEQGIVRDGIRLVVGTVLVYLCTSLLLQTRNDFRFIIPYVELAREVKGAKPYLLDTSAIIDGRVADLVEAHLIDNQLIMPNFVLIELQAIADSTDRVRRSRGRRGLEILQRLQSSKQVDLQIYDREPTELHEHPVDLKLVMLAKLLQGKVITNDFNLLQVAKLHNVETINVNALANALRPPFLPGEEIAVRILKPGEEPTQGVGYLDDGTMVVVEGARPHVNKRVFGIVTSTLQTNSGRMIFGRFERAE